MEFKLTFEEESDEIIDMILKNEKDIRTNDSDAKRLLINDFGM